MEGGPRVVGERFLYRAVKKEGCDLGVVFDSYSWEVLQIRPMSPVDAEHQRLASDDQAAQYQL
eukprot:5094815-Alexandrium_andersonii.AAC.1